jgi:hypothetical protein
MKRRDFLKLLYALGAINILAGCSSSKSESATQLKLMIPLYSYPNWWDSENYIWQKLIDIKSTHPDIDIIAIVNPSNGDFDSSNDDYVQGITDLTNADIQVVGYVYTGYGTRETNDVLTNLDSWKEYYQDIGVSGIFLDETATDLESLSYYTNLSDEAKKRDFDTIILNPGTKTNQEYIDSQIANIIVTYENSYNSFQENTPSSNNQPNGITKLSILIYQMNKEALDSTIDFAKSNDFEYIYFTDDGDDGNPWDSLSSYLEDEY